MNYKNKALIFIAFSYLGILLSPACLTQPYAEEPNLENMLNNIDQPAVWQRIPAATAEPVPNFTSPFAPAVQPKPAAAPENPFSFRNVLRTFLGSPTTPNSQDNSQAEYNAQSNLQTALDQASQAEGCANQAQYNNDKWVKKNNAGAAQNHANAARAAADRASSAAYGKSNTANDYAAQARSAADRAQAAADRARYNADTAN